MNIECEPIESNLLRPSCTMIPNGTSNSEYHIGEQEICGNSPRFGIDPHEVLIGNRISGCGI
jgi:hypothetical protein